VKWLKPHDTPALWWFSLQGSNTQEPRNLSSGAKEWNLRVGSRFKPENSRFLAWRCKGISRVYHCICRNLWSYVCRPWVPRGPPCLNLGQQSTTPRAPMGPELLCSATGSYYRTAKNGTRNHIKIKCQVQWIENNILGVPNGIIPADKNASWMILVG
jgi:hypothetical protein